MARIGETVERLKDLWLVGFMAGLVIAASVAVYGMAALVLAFAFGWALGLGDVWTEQLFLLSAALWLPIAVGHISLALKKHLPTLPINEPVIRPQASDLRSR